MNSKLGISLEIHWRFIGDSSPPLKIASDLRTYEMVIGTTEFLLVYGEDGPEIPWEVMKPL
jgi:hypothetical protein